MKKLNDYLFIIFGLIIFIKLFTIQKKRKLNKTYEKYQNSNISNFSNLGDNLEGINTTLQGISKKIDFLTGYKQIVGGTNELNISEDNNNKNNYYDKDTKFVKEEDDDDDDNNNEDYNEPTNNSEDTTNNNFEDTTNNTNSVVEQIKYKRERVNLNQPLKSNLDCISLKNSAKYGIDKLTTEQSEKLKECNLN
jgi:hypothetical protein